MTAIALLVGAVAIAVNTLLLMAADWLPLVTAHGGLLKLLARYSARPLDEVGIGGVWTRFGGPPPGSHGFQLGFHVLVGLAMAVFYALLLEPLLRGSALRKGLVYAAGAWLVNACIVLPWVGEGIAGSRSLSLAGMAWFAAAHTIFFVLMAVLYQRLASRLSAHQHPVPAGGDRSPGGPEELNRCSSRTHETRRTP